MADRPDHDVYVAHRDGCAKCGGVDRKEGGTRCEEGKCLVRAAADEGMKIMVAKGGGVVRPYSKR